MHDANQDRLMIRRMTYFRLKRLTLGRAYARFLEETLAPGGTILLVECNLSLERHRHIAEYSARTLQARAPPNHPS